MDSSHPSPTEALFALSTDALCLIAPDGIVLRTNGAWSRYAGASTEWTGRGLEPCADELAEAARACAHHATPAEVRLHVRRVDGTERAWEGTVAPVTLTDGTGRLVVMRALGPAGEAPHAELARQRQLALDAARMGWWHYDPRTRVATYDTRYVEIFGISGHERPNDEILKLIHPEDLPRVWAAVEAALDPARAERYGAEYRIRRPDGELRWIEAHGIATFEGEGAARRATSLVGTVVDVTPRRRAERELRESTALLAAISDTSSDVLFAKDAEGRLRFANPATLALIGKPLEAVMGRTDVEFLDDREAARVVMENDRRIMASERGEELEERVPLPDGTERIWLSRKAPYRDTAGRVVGLLGISRDITERKRGEERLRASEERLRLALDAARMIAWEYDPATKRVTYSGDAEEVFALRSGQPHEDRDQGYSLIHPDDVEGHRALVTRAIEEAGSYVSVYRQLRDGELLWLEERGRASRDAAGRTVRLVGVTQNITARKRMNDALRLANDRLVENDRRKDEFLAMLSHELRNPLTPIRNALYILDHADPTGQHARGARDVVTRQVAHLSRLVDDLLDVTRIARGRIELRRTDVDVAALARRTAEDHRALLRERGLELVVAVPEAPVVVDADDTRLAQVFGNLLSNAAKFTPSGGRITVAVQEGGGRVRVQVRDTGVGIEPALLPSIFDPFTQAQQPLARSEGGLGLGLAIVRAVVELHGGRVTAASAPGTGAELTVELPLAEARGAGPTEPAPHAPHAPTRACRVLVVEDNADAAESLAEVIRLLGHEVEVAHDGPDALATVAARRPDVVLCDIGLPGMNGYEVAKALRARFDGDIRLVALTGYALPEDVKRALEAGFDLHVAKPPDPARLERLFTWDRDRPATDR